MEHLSHTDTLLLIDDDPAMVRLLAKVIQRACIKQLVVEPFTDPAKAAARLDRGGVEIVLTDLEMPDVDGVALLRHAKRRCMSTQVLFLTGHSSSDALLAALELGATDYLLKPVDQDELVEVIKQAYNRQRRWRLALADTWRQGKQGIIHTAGGSIE